jgi:hypothetical protein
MVGNGPGLEDQGRRGVMERSEVEEWMDTVYKTAGDLTDSDRAEITAIMGELKAIRQRLDAMRLICNASDEVYAAYDNLEMMLAGHDASMDDSTMPF